MRATGLITAAGLSLCLALLQPAISFADDATYRQEVLARIHAFGNRNRLDIRALNRDVHADCYISITISIAIQRDGSVEEASIVKSSTVPVVDKWYQWIIMQAAPYAPLSEHYDPVPDQIVMIEEFRLDVRLWSENIRSDRPCDPIKPR